MDVAMKSFGSLLRSLRGTVSLREVGQRTGLSYSYLAKVEGGQKILKEERARELLRQGFGMKEKEIERSLLDVHLRDHGLQDAELRTLVEDLVQKRLPQGVRQRLRDLYRNYAPRPSGRAAPGATPGGRRVNKRP